MVILWTLNRGLGPFPLKPASFNWCLDANSKLLSFGHSTEVLALLLLPCTSSFFKILMLVSYFNKYFHQAFKFPVHFFREPCRLLPCLFLEDVINLSFHLLSSIILFVKSVRSISYKNYLSPEMIKKYLNILNFRKKRRCQTKNTSLLLYETMIAREACLQ